ncbi:MAG TPA: thioredoxin domain-containing protein [Blastocatellia bacterium]|nr:thioredoxin domain-containing protein [Blastocatellia bacterium]
MNIARLLALVILIGFSAVAQTPTNAQKPGDKKEEDCGCETKGGPPGVLAIVNGINITIKEINDPLAEQVRKIENQVAEARQKELDLQINSKLLEAEAKKRGMTSIKLLYTEVLSKVQDPTEAEARAFYEQNKNGIQGTFEEVKADLIKYIRDRRQEVGTDLFLTSLRAAADIKILSDNVAPPEKEADRARVLATVNGQPITLGDIEDAMRPLVFEAQEQTYNLRKQRLDARINDALIEYEARKRKMEVAALINAEVKPKIKQVTEEEAQKVYEQNKEKLGGDYARVKAQLLDYLQKTEAEKAKAAFAEQLKKDAAIMVFLKEPEAPFYNISTDDQPWKGGANAPVTIVEFTDFECPACARTQPILEEIVKEYGDKVRLVVRDFPLDQHKHAIKAAEAAEAAREQGKYWEYIALLFQNQAALGVDNLKEYATRLGLDRKKFDEALDSGKFADKVQSDMQDAWRVGVNATPTVFINGRRVRDKSRESLKAAIDAALKPATGK